MIKKQAQKHFIKYLQDNFEGSIILYITEEKSDLLYSIDQKHSLLGMTYVLPWAIALLQTNFNCFMTDATFKAMKPYVLTILNIIISNESFPVGISISPSETSDEYQRLWNHLNTSKLMNCDPNNFCNHPFVCDQGSALNKFLNDNNLEAKYCHRHLIENFGSNSMIGNWVSRILKSNLYEEFLKYANLIKMEMSIFPNNIKENISQNSIEKIEKLKLMIETDHPCFDDFHKK